jgi:hypothetical protein
VDVGTKWICRRGAASQPAMQLCTGESAAAARFRFARAHSSNLSFSSKQKFGCFVWVLLLRHCNVYDTFAENKVNGDKSESARISSPEQLDLSCGKI